MRNQRDLIKLWMILYTDRKRFVDTDVDGPLKTKSGYRPSKIQVGKAKCSVSLGDCSDLLDRLIRLERRFFNFHWNQIDFILVHVVGSALKSTIQIYRRHDLSLILMISRAFAKFFFPQKMTIWVS